MKQILLDTHAWVWSFAAEGELSEAALEAISGADVVYVSPISFFEIGQKVRLGKWPGMEKIVDRLPALLREQGGFSAPLNSEICLHASLRDWSHRDPFDRFLASTAELLELPLVSKDMAFDGLSVIRRVW